jgi:hypothetical protein
MTISARHFFCKRWLLGRNRSFLTMQSSPGAIRFHETGAEMGIPANYKSPYKTRDERKINALLEEILLVFVRRRIGDFCFDHRLSIHSAGAE